MIVFLDVGRVKSSEVGGLENDAAGETSEHRADEVEGHLEPEISCP